jgi:hypothetical protein
MLLLGDLLLAALALYAVVGTMFAFRFVVAIAPSTNERAQLGGPFFRVVLIPGAILLWPWLLYIERERLAASSRGFREAGQ